MDNKDSGLEPFAAWIEGLMRDRGYDIDSPRGGGKSKLAEDAGVHRAAVTRLLLRQSMPDLDTMRGLARALQVPVREVLIRSGKLTADDLPMATEYSSQDEESRRRMTTDEAAEALGIPAERRAMFLRIAAQFALEETDDNVGGRRAAG
ncbi:transcriptional regulator with XRE-family HTH domain [Kitasatospora gansuensis]|uniref:Transcriptional regulator with XRE-family HTH domain n=1 Tax=Kitasatospora gansuensis TaxID=258050 RepID=A0A7W7SED5_9ACTN|nr:helix-turn-helix transcriptional regulator [Kitasatospora gansuensis]MBB4948517.1 transcriptional regulator with XRE-family HTH domain [Kitasatospora gansuensis]